MCFRYYLAHNLTVSHPRKGLQPVGEESVRFWPTRLADTESHVRKLSRILNSRPVFSFLSPDGRLPLPVRIRILHTSHQSKRLHRLHSHRATPPPRANPQCLGRVGVREGSGLGLVQRHCLDLGIQRGADIHEDIGLEGRLELSKDSHTVFITTKRTHSVTL